MVVPTMDLPKGFLSRDAVGVDAKSCGPLKAIQISRYFGLSWLE
jgi:hypothetical protein